MQIGHICSNNVVTCRSNTTVLEAAQLMRRNHVGTLIVVEEVNGMLVPQGIVTDRDIVVVVLAEGLDPKSIKVIDIMKVELMTAVETEDVFETVERMRFKGVRRIPIVDKMGGLVGIVSVDDIWKFLSKEISELADVTTRQCRLDHVCRIHRPFSRTRSNQHVELVDKHDYFRVLFQYLQHFLQALLKLAAILCPSN